MAIVPALDTMQALMGNGSAFLSKTLKSSNQDWQNSVDPTIGSDSHEDGKVLASCGGFDLSTSPLCILRMMFNPATHTRTNAVANSAFASLLGIHREEFLSRIAGHDLPLFLAPLDSLRLFLYMLLEDLLAPGHLRVKHLRLAVGPPCSRRGVLVRWCSLSRLDAEGGVIEVPHDTTAFSLVNE
jgi:hypothetical protein